MESKSAAGFADQKRRATDRGATAPESMREAAADARLEGEPRLERLARLSATINGGPRVAQTKALAEKLDRRARDRAPAPIRGRSNATGLPDPLKAGIETLSGIALDDVRVHYGSAEPARLQAHAFTRGTDIHVAPGQEHHLPHEAWHVVQQAQGRVAPTVQMKEGVFVNDDTRLEQEADVMGARAAALRDWSRSGLAPARAASGDVQARAPAGGIGVIQGVFAVEVLVDRNEKGVRKVVGIRFGERPPTQFGQAQEDHVVAWAAKTNELTQTLSQADDLKDAVDLLLLMIDDANAELRDPAINKVVEGVSAKRREAVDELDLMSALQEGIRRFLEAYNANPHATRLRLGPSDRTEGARVKKARNTMAKLAGTTDKDIPDDKTHKTLIDTCVVAMMNQFQLDMSAREITEEKKKGYPKAVTAFSSSLSSGLGAIQGGALYKSVDAIVDAYIERQAAQIGFDSSACAVIKRQIIANNASLAARLDEGVDKMEN